LADVSTAGYDAKSGHVYRNGNVMYEVGVALACRHSSEVLLVRDDRYPFLFDVSTIPHETIDFSDATGAKERVHTLLRQRLDERDRLRDARISRMLSTLEPYADSWLQQWVRQFGPQDLISIPVETAVEGAALARLADDGFIRYEGFHNDAKVGYRWTDLGYAAAKCIADRPPLPPIADEFVEGTKVTQAAVAERKLADAIRRQKSLMEPPMKPPVTVAALRADLIPDKDLNGLDMRNADLQGVSLAYRELRAADFSGSDLTKARFPGCDLRAANFAGARLIDTSFHASDLRGANLQQATLVRTDFHEARLEGADLRATLDRVDLRATYDGQTQWPQGFDPDAAGAVRIGEDAVPTPPTETDSIPETRTASNSLSRGE